MPRRRLLGHALSLHPSSFRRVTLIILNYREISNGSYFSLFPSPIIALYSHNLTKMLRLEKYVSVELYKTPDLIRLKNIKFEYF